MKSLVLKTLHKGAGLLSLPALIKWSGKPLFMPFYHSIGEVADLPHIRHLYQPRNKETFEKDLDFFLKHFEPVSLDTLFQKKGKFTKPTFFLSFDDGLREVYELIAPILKKKGVPATFFLNAGFVDNKDLFFRYKVSLLIDRIEQQALSEKEIKSLKEISPLFSEASSSENLIPLLKSISYLNKELLDEGASILKVDFSEFLNNYQPYLSSHQIEELIEDGFNFGGHSIDHPLFNQLTLEAQLEQAKESVAFISQNFKIGIKVFSFPFTDDQVSEEFFNQAFSNKHFDCSFGTAGLKDEPLEHHYQRFPMEGLDLSAEKLVKTEYAYYLLKGIGGKRRMVR